MGQQFFGTRPSQRLTTVDPFWHHEIAAPESHNSRKLVAGVVVQSHHEFNVRNQYGTIRLNIDSEMLPKRKNGQRQQKAHGSACILHSAETDATGKPLVALRGDKFRAFGADSPGVCDIFWFSRLLADLDYACPVFDICRALEGVARG